MDYETRATSRKEIRLYAKIFRSLCGLSPFEIIDPVALLDRLPSIDIFQDVSYEIINDFELPSDIASRCISTTYGYLIQIKESIYMGAFKRNIGGYRMHIMHEIVHVFADIMNFKPLSKSGYQNSELPKHKSLEWVVKAITGEIMIPYETSKGMSVKEIVNTFHVSQEAAEYRLKLNKN